MTFIKIFVLISISASDWYLWMALLQNTGSHNCNNDIYDVYAFSTYLSFASLEKEMATHSSILAWRIPGTEEPGVLQSVGHINILLCWKYAIPCLQYTQNTEHLPLLVIA